MMDKLHRVELLVADLEGYDVSVILQNIENCLNRGAMNSVVHTLKKETKDFIYEGDETYLNSTHRTPKECITYFENIENDEYQTYLKLKEKFE